MYLRVSALSFTEKISDASTCTFTHSHQHQHQNNPYPCLDRRTPTMSTQDQKSSSSTQTSCATQVPLEETPTKRVQRDPSDCDANILRNTKSEKPAGSTAAPPTPTRHQVDHPAPAKISDKATEKQANKQANENLITPDENYISTFWDGAEELWHNLDTMDRASLLAKYPHLEGLISERIVIFYYDIYLMKH